jgi:hypothetical protein
MRTLIIKGRDSLMIPDIGIMIGAYIITRMISFLTRKEERAESPVVKVLAVITTIITVIVIIDLFSKGTNTTLPSSF